MLLAHNAPQQARTSDPTIDLFLAVGQVQDPDCCAQVPGGVSAAHEAPSQQAAAAQPQMPQQPPVPQHVALPAHSVHDSATTVQSVDFSKALQQAQAQAQVQGMGSQVSRVTESRVHLQTQALDCSGIWQNARHLQPCNEAGSA